MAEFLKSALGYLGNNLSGQQDNDFVGQNVEMGDFKLRVRRVIAEGGFAFVFVAQDSKTGKEYALKRLLASDADKTKSIINEITSLKKVSNHPNIIQFVAAASIGKQESEHGQAEFLILTELCTGGQLIDALKGQCLTPEHVLQIFYQTCSAVHHLHKQNPPIAHRDLKIENLLVSSEQRVKLCDFGSCTTTSFYPDVTWTAGRRSLVEDELARCTTPMYRSPEMLDLYQNLPINEQADIWALGCILYFLCYGVHPFEDSAKLRIINANFTIPQSDLKFIDFHDLIRTMLRIHPMERPNIVDVLEKLEEIATRLAVNPQSAIHLQQEQPVDNNSPPSAHPAGGHLTPSSAPSTHPPNMPSGIGGGGGGIGGIGGGGGGSGGIGGSGGGGFSLFGQLREGAVNLVKNVKEASTKVVESVSQSVNRGDMDMSYLTTRLIVMSFPGDGVEFPGRNHIEDVRMYLDNKHPCSYAVYNLSGRTYRAAKFENRVSECGWKQGRSPPFFLLLSICQNMHRWQKQFAKNVLVVHCIDGRSSSAVVACSFLCYSKLVDSMEKAILLFSKKRSNPILSASQKRYINYVLELANQTSPSISPSLSSPLFFPHNRSIHLHQIVIHPVPCFNKLKNGCRPYLDVYVGEERVVTTIQDYESMRSYTVVDGKILFQLNAMLTDDVIISLYHARSTIGSKVQGKITSLKIFDIQFFCGFIAPGTKEINFKLSDLDNTDSSDKYPEGFQVSIGISVNDEEEAPSDILKSLREGSIKGHSSPKHVVSSEMELQRINKELNAAIQSKTVEPSSTDDSPRSKFFVPLNVPETGPKFKSGGRGPPPEKPPPPKMLSNRQVVDEINKRREESIDFDHFSKDRNKMDIQSSDPVVESGNLVDIEALIGEEVPTSSDEWPNYSEQTSYVMDQDLFDVGSHDPTNFELLVDCNPSESEIGNKQPAQDNDNDNDPFNLFSNDPKIFSTSSTARSNNPFENNEPSTQQEKQSDFSSFHSSFDPFNSIPSKPPKSSTPPTNNSSREDDFLSFLDNITNGPTTTTDQSSSMTSKITKSESSDNLLGSWTQEMLTSNLTSIPRPSSFVTINPSSSSSSPAFGSSTVGAKKPNNMTQDRYQTPNGSSANQKHQDSNFDPFAKFGNLNLSSKEFKHKVSPPMGGSPNHTTTTNNPYKPFATNAFAQNVPPAFNQPPNHSGFSSVIGNRDERGLKKHFGPKPVVPEDAFGDLLGGFTSTSRNEPKTIKELERKLINPTDLDPDVLKVRDWVKAKKGIRALLCSLHTILQNETQWKEVGMHQVMSADQVKKVYRKALLTVHPDKPSGIPETLARETFNALHKAWSEFVESGMKSW